MHTVHADVKSDCLEVKQSVSDVCDVNESRDINIARRRCLQETSYRLLLHDQQPVTLAFHQPGAAAATLPITFAD